MRQAYPSRFSHSKDLPWLREVDWLESHTLACVPLTALRRPTPEVLREDCYFD